jgi:hypothetical protein
MVKHCKHPTCSATCRRSKPVKKNYRIRPYSKKRQKTNRHYNERAEIFRKANPYCKIIAPGGCTRLTQGVHHKRGRGKYLLDELTWLPACNYCNGYVDTHPEWATAMGFVESRLANYSDDDPDLCLPGFD